MKLQDERARTRSLAGAPTILERAPESHPTEIRSQVGDYNNKTKSTTFNKFLSTISFLGPEYENRSTALSRREGEAPGSRVPSAGPARGTRAVPGTRPGTAPGTRCPAGTAASRTPWDAAVGTTARTSRCEGCRRANHPCSSRGWASRAWRRRTRARRRWAGRRARRARTQCDAAARPRAGGETRAHRRPTIEPCSE